MISPGALQRLDIVVAAAVEGAPQNDPPQAPVEGSCYLVGDTPSGDWLQYPAHLAGFGSGGWRFIAPRRGMAVFVKTTQTVASYQSEGWDLGTVRAVKLVIDDRQVVGPQGAAIADPSGGVTADAEARLAIASILAALRQHGLISA